MSQAIKVALQKHGIDDFHVIYRNEIGSVIDDTEKQAGSPDNSQTMPEAPDALWELIAAVLVGVHKQCAENSYADSLDLVRAKAFLDEMVSQFGLTAFDVNSDAGCDVAVEKDYFMNLFSSVNDYEKVKAFLVKIEDIHITGSVVKNNKVNRLRGLVTVSYRKTDGVLGKVRLSGKIPADVGTALRAPYMATVNKDALIDLSIFDEKEPVVSKPAERKVFDQNVSKPEPRASYWKLSNEDKEEIAEMVARKLSERILIQIAPETVVGAPKPKRKPYHKNRPYVA